MKPVLRVLALAAVIVALTTGAASAVVVTFDDLPTPIGFYGTDPIPDGYGGLQWDSNFWYMDTTIYSTGHPYPSGYLNGVVSGTNVAVNAWALSVGMESASAFDFMGAYFTAAWNDNLNITIEGWLGGSLLYTQTAIVQYTGPAWVTCDYTGVDNVTFTSFGGTDHDLNDDGEGVHFAMDNMTYQRAVPAPSALISLMTGLVCLGGYGLRKWRL